MATRLPRMMRLPGRSRRIAIEWNLHDWLGGNYSTLTQAVNKLNSLGVSGPVVLNLLDSSNTTSPENTGETFPIIINSVPGASATNTVTIKPAGR